MWGPRGMGGQICSRHKLRAGAGWKSANAAITRVSRMASNTAVGQGRTGVPKDSSEERPRHHCEI